MNQDIIPAYANPVKSTLQKIQSSKELPFVNVLSEASIQEKISELDYRNRVFTPDLTIFAFLSQVVGTDQSCQMAVAQIIAHLVRCGKEAPSANTAAYCKARARLPEELLATLTKESAQSLEQEVKPEWLWRKRHVKMPDGTSVSMPDTPLNQAIYPQPDSQKKALAFLLQEW